LLVPLNLCDTRDRCPGELVGNVNMTTENSNVREMERRAKAAGPEKRALIEKYRKMDVIVLWDDIGILSPY